MKSGEFTIKIECAGADCNISTEVEGDSMGIAIALAYTLVDSIRVTGTNENARFELLHAVMSGIMRQASDTFSDNYKEEDDE